MPRRSEGAAAHDLRWASGADAESIALLLAEAFIAKFGPDNPPGVAEAYAATELTASVISALIAEPRSRWLVALDDDVLVGVAHLDASSSHPSVRAVRPLQLARLYTRPDRTGSGVGAGLMERILTEARAGGHDALWLGVWEHNEGALAFYRRWGFEQVGEVVFRLGDDDQTDLVLVRAL